MADVVKLTAPTAPPMPVDAEVVAALEGLLQAAKRGDFNGLCAVTVTSPHVGSYTGCGTQWVGASVSNGVHIALGAVEVLKERLLRELVVFDNSKDASQC